MDAPKTTPSVIVSHLDITFRVVGGKRAAAPAGADDESVFRSLLGRGKDLGNAQIVEAVKDVSFVAYHGESIGIVGRNGSGKSTMLRAIAGLLPPTKGQVYLRGEPALLGVNAVLMSGLTGERNIYIGGQALGLTRAQVRERFNDIVEFSGIGGESADALGQLLGLETFSSSWPIIRFDEIAAFSGIGDAVYRPMSTYSSGMGARLRFAISTAAAPDVLLIDEALATGDADFKARSSAKVDEIRSEASTVFLVSHSDATIRALCDRVLWMHRGELIADGPTDVVMTAYEATSPKKPAAKPKPAPTPPTLESAPQPPAPKDSAPKPPTPTQPTPKPDPPTPGPT